MSTKPRVVMVSGGFDPLHSGHLDMFAAAKALGDRLIVAVNSDEWLIKKKGYCFLPLRQRMRIISECRWVDDAVPAFTDNDGYIVPSLKMYRPDIFANGGDRTEEDTPQAERDACADMGIQTVFGVGGSKTASSSEFASMLLRHDVVQRPWGRFTVVRRAPTNWVKLLEVEPGQALSLQSHERREEFWVCVSGKGHFQRGDTKYPFYPGALARFSTNVKHRLMNTGSEVMIVAEIALGRVDEGDIIRYEDDYGRV